MAKFYDRTPQSCRASCDGDQSQTFHRASKAACRTLRIVFWIALLLGVIPVSAQNKIWDKAFGGTYDDIPTAIATTPDGGHLLAGHSLSGPSVPDFWVIRLDANSNTLWEKRYTGIYSRLMEAVTTSDGGFLLGGDAYPPSVGNTDFYVLRIDANGNKLWDNFFGGDNFQNLHSIVATDDGGFLLGGNTVLPYDEVLGVRNIGLVVKINAQGNKVWENTFMELRFTSVRSMVPTSDGGYFLGCFTTDDLIGQYYYWLVKIDANGNLLWEKSFDGSSEDNASAMVRTSDGGVLIGGTSYSVAGGDVSQPSQGASDYWVVRTDANGNKLWDKRFGGSNFENLTSLITTADNGFLLGGNTESPQSGDVSEPSRGQTDFWVVKIDSMGNKHWDKRFGGSSSETIHALATTYDNGFLLGGTSRSGQNGDKTQPSFGSTDYWLVKIDGNKQNQVINFPAIADMIYGDEPFALTADATSGLPVVYTVGAGSEAVISINGNVVKLLQPGTATIIASQPGNNVFHPAAPDSVSFSILPIPVQDLILTSVCSDEPAVQRKWLVHNDNNFNVDYTWTVLPSFQSGTGTASPGDNFFFTNTIAGANNLKLFWLDENGVQQEVEKVSTGEDCTSPSCFAFSVSNFSQGKTKNGKVIEALRSNPLLALGAPQENDSYNFVSLGFGGSITLELLTPLNDTNGYDPDFILVETSFGRADEKCFAGGNTFNYPETAVIEVSDGVSWRSLPDSYCRTSFVDISSVIDNNFPYVKLIRIKDFTNKEYFNNNAEGFDVDGLIVCPQEVEKAFMQYTNSRVGGAALWDPTLFNRAPNEAQDGNGSITIFPNPADKQITIEVFSEKDSGASLQIISAVGAVQKNSQHSLKPGMNTITEDVVNLAAGVYMVKIGNQSVRFVKE